MNPNFPWRLLLLILLNNKFCHGFWGKPVSHGGYKARIAGGHVAFIINHKHHAHLFPKQCGGTIIGAKYILSARQCDHPQLTVKVGVDNLQGVTVGDHTIKQKHFFNMRQGTFRIYGIDYQTMLLELDAGLDFNDRVGAVTLGSGWNLIADGKIGVITGFGATDERSGNSLILHAVEIPMFTHKTCIATYSEYMTHLSQTHDLIEFCGGYDFSDVSKLGGHHTICQGDIGGGLIMNGLLIGVAVRNYGCGEGKHPGIFESVAAFSVWIFPIIGTNDGVKFNARYGPQ